MGINPNEVKTTVHLVEEGVDAAAAAIHSSPTAMKLLEETGLHMPRVPHVELSAPAILGERIGNLLTPAKIENFARDLFGRLESHPSVDFELEERLSHTGWNQSRKQAIAERAIAKAGYKLNEVSGLDDVRDTRALYADLKGAPAARGALTSFVNARDEYRDATSAYRKAVTGPKFADTYAAGRSLIEQTGLIKPRFKVSRELGGADASYYNFTVSYPHSAFDESSISLVKSTAHELTHLEQHQLEMFLTADQLGVGAQATQSEIHEIGQRLSTMGIETTTDAIQKGMQLRNGRFLTEDAAERAHATIQSAQHLQTLWGNTGQIRHRLEILKQMEARATYGNDARGVAFDLTHPQTGLALCQELFGQEKGSAVFAKYAQKPDATTLADDINAAIDSNTLQMEPYYKAYKVSRHEVEAFANGDLAASFHPPQYVLKGKLNFDEF